MFGQVYLVCTDILECSYFLGSKSLYAMRAKDLKLFGLYLGFDAGQHNGQQVLFLFFVSYRIPVICLVG